MNQQNPFEKIKLPGVKNILVIASGKGGVGKSTVAANLAISLAREGYKTGIFDADLYGPSIPILFGAENEKPEIISRDGKQWIVPVTKYGVKIISIDFFKTPKKSLIWRGPAASAGLTQIISETDWGELDYLIIDFPPGTGDIQLTSIQKLELSGAILVTTPPKISVADAEKAADMFNSAMIRVPILGVVENMSYFIPEKHPDEKYYLFGQGGGQQLANHLNVTVLSKIPLVCDASELTDHGKTIFSSTNKIIINHFQALATHIVNLEIKKPAREFIYLKKQ